MFFYWTGVEEILIFDVKLCVGRRNHGSSPNLVLVRSVEIDLILVIYVLSI